jgi:hypothetical protein
MRADRPTPHRRRGGERAIRRDTVVFFETPIAGPLPEDLRLIP